MLNVDDLPGEEQFNSPQVYTVSADKKAISGGTNPLYELNQLPLAPRDAKSVVGIWSQPTKPDWYPDVNATSFFSDKFAEYTQHGQPVLSDPLIPSSVAHVRLAYSQDGSQIWFSGVRNEAGPQMFVIPYYGVLSADGITLYVDALEYTYSRLPYSFQTIECKGQRG